MTLPNQNLFFLRQQKEWSEILTGFEGRNRYALCDSNHGLIANVAEKSSGIFGFLIRTILRRHRSFEAAAVTPNGETLFQIHHPFYWFFSSVFVSDASGKRLGSIHRRFRFFTRAYDILDDSGVVFAKIYAGFFRIWKFDIQNANGTACGEITKKWGGILREAFTDADKFLIQFNGEAQNWSPAQKTVLVAGAIAVDFDKFEDNEKRR